MGRLFKVPFLLLTVLGLTLSSARGAETPKPPSAEPRASSGTVAVVAARFVPQSNFITFAEGKGKGAARGVVREITDALPAMHLSDALVQRLLTALARETAVQLRSIDALGPASPEEHPFYQSLLGAGGVDTVLEVAVTSVGLEGDEHTPLITFFMDVQTRLVRVADNGERHSFRFHGRAVLLDAWIADNGQLLREQFTQGYESLADQITTALFLLTPLKVASLKEVDAGPEEIQQACWLSPIYPNIEWGEAKFHWSWNPLSAPGDQVEPAKLLYPAVDSLQPRLRWKAFSPDKDVRKRGRPPISDVRYDLRVWKVDAGYPGLLVYDREGLPESFHKLEHPLEPGSQYFWSVRARFKAGSREEVTRWAFMARAEAISRGAFPVAGCNKDQVPNASFFRFATPIASEHPRRASGASPKVPATVSAHTPAVAASAHKPSPSAVQKGVASTPYKIAIFPFESDSKCIGESRPSDEKFASQLGAIIATNDSLKLAYSYYDSRLNQPPIKKRGRLWKGSKPDLTQVFSLGQARGVDAVVMYWRAESSPGIPYCTSRMPPFPIEAYVIDVKQGKIYTLRGREKDFGAMTEQTLAMFLAAAQPKVVAAAPPAETTSEHPQRASGATPKVPATVSMHASAVVASARTPSPIGPNWVQKPIQDFQSIAGTWQGSGLTSKGKAFDLEITYRDDGSYTFRANRGTPRSARGMRIESGVVKGKSYTTGDAVTVTLYEDQNGGRILKARRADGLTWTVKPKQ